MRSCCHNGNDADAACETDSYGIGDAIDAPALDDHQCFDIFTVRTCGFIVGVLSKITDFGILDSNIYGKEVMDLIPVVMDKCQFT